jgi:hypothetical protein
MNAVLCCNHSLCKSSNGLKPASALSLDYKQTDYYIDVNSSPGKGSDKLAVRVIGLSCNTLGMELGTRKYKH